MPDETILRVGIEFDISALKSGMAEAASLSKAELAKLKSEYASAATAIKGTMAGLAESIVVSSDDASRAIAELRTQISGLTETELSAAGLAAESVIPAPFTRPDTPTPSVAPSPVSSTVSPAPLSEEVAETAPALAASGHRRHFPVAIRDEREDLNQPFETAFEHAGTTPFTVLKQKTPEQVVQPIAPAEVLPQVAPTPAQQIVQSIPAAEITAEVAPAISAAAAELPVAPAIPRAAVTETQSSKPIDREYLTQQARSDGERADRMVNGPSGADRAESEYYYGRSKFWGDLANGVPFQEAHAKLDSNWRSYAAQNNQRIGSTGKIQLGPSSGLSNSGHRYVSPDKAESDIPHLTQMGRNAGIEPQATPITPPAPSEIATPGTAAEILPPAAHPSVTPIEEPTREVTAKTALPAAQEGRGASQLGAASGKLGTHVVQFPSGRWGLAGSVPKELGYERIAGGAATPEDIANASIAGPKVAGLKTRSWSTREAVEAALAGEPEPLPETARAPEVAEPPVEEHAPKRTSSPTSALARRQSRQASEKQTYQAELARQQAIRAQTPVEVAPEEPAPPTVAGIAHSAGPVAPINEPATAAKASVTAATTALQEPRTRSIAGADTRIPVPGESTIYPARYALREASDVEPSHNAQTFDPNPLYEHRNDRDYTKPEAKARVIEQAQHFDPAYHLSDNPDAVNGPSIVDPRGNVLGGNSRAMALQRAYSSENPEAANAYREMLAAKAPGFGIDPAQVGAMQQPMLVRQTGEVPNPQAAITDFNKTGTAALSASERAVADSHRVSPKTLDYLASKIADEGEEGTLAKVLGGSKGPDIIKRLVEDQVITPQERPQYLDQKSGLVTPEGKQRVSRLMTGRLFDTSEDYENAAPELRNKLEKVVGPVARTEGIEGFNIAPQVKEGVAIQTEAKQRGIRNLDDLRSQQGMFGERGYSDEGYAIAHKLDEPQAKIGSSFRQYASDAEVAGKGAGLGLYEPPTRQRAFADAFNQGNVIEPAPGAGAARVTERTTAGSSPLAALAPEPRAIEAPSKPPPFAGAATRPEIDDFFRKALGAGSGVDQAEALLQRPEIQDVSRRFAEKGIHRELLTKLADSGLGIQPDKSFVESTGSIGRFRRGGRGQAPDRIAYDSASAELLPNVLTHEIGHAVDHELYGSGGLGKDPGAHLLLDTPEPGQPHYESWRKASRDFDAEAGDRSIIGGGNWAPMAPDADPSVERVMAEKERFAESFAQHYHSENPDETFKETPKSRGAIEDIVEGKTLGETYRAPSVGNAANETVEKSSISDAQTEFKSAEAERRSEIERTASVQKEADQKALADLKEEKELAPQAAAPPAAPPPQPPAAPPAAPPPGDDDPKKKIAEENQAVDERIRKRREETAAVLEGRTKEQAATRETGTVETDESTRELADHKQTAQSETVNLREQLAKQQAELEQATANRKAIAKQMAEIPEKNAVGAPNTGVREGFRAALDEEKAKEQQLGEQVRVTTAAIKEQENSVRGNQSQSTATSIDTSASKVQEAEAQKTAAVVQGEADQDAAVAAGEAQKTAAYQKAGSEQTAEVNRGTSRSRAAVQEATDGAKQGATAQVEEAKKSAAASVQSSQERVRAARASAAAEVEASGSVASVLRLHLAIQGEEQKRLASTKSTILKAMAAEEQAAARAGIEGNSQASAAIAGYRKALQENLDAQAELKAEIQATTAALEAESGAMGTFSNRAAKAQVVVGSLTDSTGRAEIGLMRMLGASKTLGPALEAVFPVFMALAFIEIIAQIPQKIRDMSDELVGFGKEEQKAMQEMVSENLKAVKEAHGLHDALNDTSTIGLVGLAKTNAELKVLRQNTLDATKTAEELSKKTINPKIEENKRLDPIGSGQAWSMGAGVQNLYQGTLGHWDGIAHMLQGKGGESTAQIIAENKKTIAEFSKLEKELNDQAQYQAPKQQAALERTGYETRLADARELSKAQTEGERKMQEALIRGEEQFTREKRALHRISAQEEAIELKEEAEELLRIELKSIAERRAAALTLQRVTGKPAGPELKALAAEENVDRTQYAAKVGTQGEVLPSSAPPAPSSVRDIIAPLPTAPSYQAEPGVTGQINTARIADAERDVEDATRSAIDLNKKKGDVQVRLEEQNAREVYAATREAAERKAYLLEGAAQKETATLMKTEGERTAIEKEALQNEIAIAQARADREPEDPKLKRDLITLHADLENLAKEHQGREAAIRREGDRTALEDHKRMIQEREKLADEELQNQIRHIQAMNASVEVAIHATKELDIEFPNVTPQLPKQPVGQQIKQNVVTLGATSGEIGDLVKEDQQMAALHQKEYQEAIAANQREQQIYAQNPEKLRALLGQEQQIQDRYNQQVLQDAVKLTKDLEKNWQDFFNTFNRGFSQAINSAMLGQKSFGKSMADLYNQLVLQEINYVASWVLKEGEKWAMSKLFSVQAKVVQSAADATKVASASSANAVILAGTTATNTAITVSNTAVNTARAAGEAANVTVVTAGNATILASTLPANVAMASSYAALAAVAAFASVMEALPFPENVAVAPPVAAATLAEGLVFAGMAALEKGGIVGNTGIVLAHEGEKVVDAQLTRMLIDVAHGDGPVQAQAVASPQWSNVYSDLRSMQSETRQSVERYGSSISEVRSSVDRLSAHTENYKETISHLASIDREVRVHEQKHMDAAGTYAIGAPHYSTVAGPDGKPYAVAGYVNLDASPIAGNPGATVEKMRVIEASARAPHEMSDADKNVASAAYSMRHEALREMTSSHYKESQRVEPVAAAYPAMRSVSPVVSMPSVILPTAHLELFQPRGLERAALSSNVQQMFASSGGTHVHAPVHYSPTIHAGTNMSTEEFGKMLGGHADHIGRIAGKQYGKFNR